MRDRFETIEGAERCIVSLRRYRNLHPTFSKVHTHLFFSAKTDAKLSFVQQIHKIPGTTYAQGYLAASGSSTTSWDGKDEISGSSVGGVSAGDASFKVKMESLHDPTSTNLYMEGSAFCFIEHLDRIYLCFLFYYRLPLSIDEPVSYFFLSFCQDLIFDALFRLLLLWFPHIVLAAVVSSRRG